MTTPRTHDHDDLLAQAITDLDAAPPVALTDDQRARADDTLARILAAQPSAVPGPVASITRRPRRLGRGILLVAAVLALTLVISMSGLVGGGTAYASWTARPHQLPLAEQEELAQQCRDILTGPPGAPVAPGIPTDADLRDADLVLADSRGDWTYVVLSGKNGLEATCLVDEGSRFLGVIPRAGSAAGSYGFLVIPTPADDEIVGSGLMATSSDEGSYWATEGHVGSHVAGVEILTLTGAVIDATVTNGRFAAWWPERMGVDDAGGMEQVSYRVTLTDGTVLGPLSYDDISHAPPE